MPDSTDTLSADEALILNQTAGVSTDEADGVVADQTDEQKRKRLVALLKLIAHALQGL